MLRNSEADIENRPCARENCGKVVCSELPTCPRKVVRKMCGGISKCAELVRNLCGGATAQISHSIGVGLPRMCAHKAHAIFTHILNCSLRPGCTGKKCLNFRELVLKTSSLCGMPTPRCIAYVPILFVFVPFSLELIFSLPCLPFRRARAYGEDIDSCAMSADENVFVMAFWGLVVF